jgi:glycosyltransferase involved in cell wall biosynthesis
MRRAGIFVSPSRYEPFGLAALEAAEAGAAPVLADIPTYRELWSGAARFVPADDPEAFARAVNELAADDRERTNLGAAARRRASGFSPQRQLAGLLSLYEAAAQSMPRVERNL